MSYIEPHLQAREWGSLVEHVLSMLQILGRGKGGKGRTEGEQKASFTHLKTLHLPTEYARIDGFMYSQNCSNVTAVYFHNLL